MIMQDYQHFYQRISAPIRKHPRQVTVLRLTNRAIEVLMYLAYLGMVGQQVWTRHGAAWSIIVVPGVGFVLVSLARNFLNVPRPYEQWTLCPLISREKTGDSFPSRHVFSAMTIAMVAYRVWWPLGIFLVFLTVLLALIRVVGGVHYPKDVLAGMAAGLVCGALLWLF
ncbi:phosphatase PAP2 family protein [Limosilactobacillus panis]|uniref:phosphatase PAP2 family protein n=1 Tax=Limosilactobacillus panis TaxID=47493 RepID=UPI0021BBE3C9|nr:phosphatase PAP2 family protein [Limosilactobacillus panis]